MHPGQINSIRYTTGRVRNAIRGHSFLMHGRVHQSRRQLRSPDMPSNQSILGRRSPRAVRSYHPTCTSCRLRPTLGMDRLYNQPTLCKPRFWRSHHICRFARFAPLNQRRLVIRNMPFIKAPAYRRDSLDVPHLSSTTHRHWWKLSPIDPNEHVAHSRFAARSIIKSGKYREYTCWSKPHPPRRAMCSRDGFGPRRTSIQ